MGMGRPIRLMWATVECEAAVQAARLLRRLGLFATREDAVLILPPTKTDGSLGDETILSALCEALRAKGCSRVDLLHFNFNDSWKRLSCFDAEVDVFSCFHTPRLGDWWRMVFTMLRYRRFHVAGADVMDGFHSQVTAVFGLRLLRLAARLGLDVRLLGFSFNSIPTKRVVYEFLQLPASVQLFARDPESWKRLEESHLPPATLAADPAYLFRRGTVSPSVMPILDWILEARKKGGEILGINLSSFSLDLKQADSPELAVQPIVNALQEVQKEHINLHYVLIPHDLRSLGAPSDCELLRALQSVLAKDGSDRVRMLPEDITPSDIDAVAAAVDVVFSCRMHLAIACFRNATPVAAVEYQDKFKGAFSFLGLSELVIDRDAFLQTRSLSQCLLTLLENKVMFQDRIKERYADVVRRAALNVADKDTTERHAPQ